MNTFPNNKYPRRGEIYYVSKGNSLSTGSETWSNRHAIIVSANHINKFNNVVQVVYITTQGKSNIPTHVDISTKRTHRIAICEQITAVDKSRIVEYKGCLSPYQLQKIDEAMLFDLGLYGRIRNKSLDKYMSDMV